MDTIEPIDQPVLEPDEEYDKFCGKVFMTTKKNIIIHCLLCETKYNGFDSYVQHIQSHLADSTDTFEEELHESDENSGEEQESMIEEELPIEFLQKKSKISVQKSVVKPKPKRILLPKEIEVRAHPVRIITSEKGVFSCPHCPQRFFLEYALRAHIKEHDKNRRFKCSICGMQCKTSGSLQTHVRRHEKNKPFQCTECERSFVNPSELQYHMRNHTGEKPYQCEDCGIRFAYRCTLRSHRKRHHTFQKDYVCVVCSKRFYCVRYLRDHMAKHTKEPNYECEKCGKKFNTSSNFGLHKRKHRQQEEAEKQQLEVAQTIDSTTVDEVLVNVLN